MWFFIGTGQIEEGFKMLMLGVKVKSCRLSVSNLVGESKLEGPELSKE
jgi:hypothetical protein